MRPPLPTLLPSALPCWRWMTLGAALLGAARLAQAGSPLAAAESEFAPVEVVSRILAYTRWPGEPRPLLACISRQADDTAALLARLQTPESTRPVLARDIAPDAPVPAGCDLVFFAGWTLARQQAALQALASRPVLTIGRGAEFCSDGGMFCLETRGDGTRFEVNLDAVARSGLRIHPQVLRLARPGGRSG
ncbi:YfiR family protein [Ideonella oryzae]|uniref:YfiR family protein n=1 Tax=Ideonella oryzae TaxID=2937441 RepID=A0ABT1BRI5_9BURK|nr:YfiR family protein [Ideonella oryzae]MCO5978142.1 YfiR family protein [Ideonella oryzae]